MMLYAGNTLIGNSGETGKDGIYADQERGIFIIIHSLCGTDAENQALRLALEILCARLEREIGSINERIREAITLANNEVYQLNLASHPGRESASFMLTVVIVEDQWLITGSVGTTQIYQISSQLMKPLNQVYGQAHQDSDIKRYIGSELHEPDDANFIDVIKVSLEPELALLFCSRSLIKAISEKDIFLTIQQQPGNRARLVRSLLNSAYETYNAENFSVLFIEGQHFARALRRSNKMQEGSQAAEDSGKRVPSGKG
jgi:serine/threonine protein phosphatase PrpC